MNASNSTIAIWSYGLTALCYFALTAHVLLRQRASNADISGKALAAAAAASSAWGLAGLLVALDLSTALRDFQRVFDVFLYASWYIFLLVLLGSAPTRTNGATRWLTAAGAGAVLFSLASLGLPALTQAQPELPRASQFAFLGMVVFGLVLLEQLFRNATADSRWNIKPLGIGLGAAFVFDLYFHSNTLLFNRVDETVYAVRGFAYLVMAPLIALTIFRAGARKKLRVALSQHAVFHTTSLVAVGIYLLAASSAGYYVRYWGGSWGGALQLALLFTALVLLILLAFSGTTRAKLRVLVGKHFFRYRYDYREEWQKFTKALATENSTDPMGQRAIRGLADMVESPAGTLWLKEPQGRRYIQRARWNLPETIASEADDSPLINFLANSGWVINLEEYRYLPSRYQGLSLPMWLSEIPNAWLIVPLSTATEAIGFVVLTTARTPIEINWEVNDLLKTAGSQAASFLAQMQATEALLEARKFEAFNRMSAFVVHDLKNIVTQLSLLAKNAEKHRDNPEFQRDMVLTVSHSVERMKQLMLQLREGTTPNKSVSGVVLTDVAQRVFAAKIGQFPALKLDIRQQVVTRGHEDRIERVIGHLVQNAIEATGPSGQVWIAVDRESGMAVVEVGDTGKGMSAEFIRERLFKPFQTTKSAGMGIGAHESFQYVQELGGKIMVESTVDVGSRFRLTLPLIEVSSASDLQLEAA
jgi:putative PEP-CTERM system histidine kinase